MATTYAAYANVMHAHRAQSKQASTRSSVSSTGSVEQQQKKSKWQRFLDEMKPVEKTQPPVGIYEPVIKSGHLFGSFTNELKTVEEPVTPTGIYRPLIKSGDLFASKNNGSSSEKVSMGRRVSQGYEKFKTVVGGEKVAF